MEFKTGNIIPHTQKYGGWFFGHFNSDDPYLQNNDFALKWSKRQKGYFCDFKKIPENDQRTLTVLIYGKVELTYQNGTRFILESEGDYVFSRPRAPHQVKVYEDSLMLNIRWPSIDDPHFYERMEKFRTNDFGNLNDSLQEANKSN